MVAFNTPGVLMDSMAEIHSEQEKTRREIADYFREFADELESGTAGRQTTDRSQTTEPRASDQTPDEPVSADDKVTIIVGNESATINPPQTLSFVIDIDTESSLMETGAERSATFSLRWSGEHVEADDTLEIE